MDGALGRLLVTVCVLLTMPGRGAAISCYYGSNDFGVQETSMTCTTGLDACVTFKFTTATKTGTVYACTSQQNCQNPITHKTTLESGVQATGFTGTAGNIVCCTANNCNRGAAHRVVVSMSSSPYLILPVSLLLSRVFA